MEPEKIDDLSVVENCQKGQLDEFSILYEKYVKKIYDFIFFKTHHKETAEDLASQTFMKALESIQRFDSSKASFSTWLYRIARNSVIDHYRVSKKTVDISDAWDLKSSENLFEKIKETEDLDKVRQYLKNFDATKRDIVILRVWEGLSYKEIAAIVNKSESNCKMIFSRIVKKIREDVILIYLLLLIS
jgi:RNA polymerase sigma-70 factor (ECF subfamily)